MFKIAALGLILLVLSLNAQMLSRTKVLMGTFVTLSLEKKDKKYIQPAFKLLENIEKSISSYKESSPISILNTHGYTHLDTYSYEALCLGKRYYKESEGYFNIAIGSITKDAYRFGENERVVSAKMLREFSTTLQELDFNKTEATLGKGVKIDLGGMGKGYSIDKVAEFFKKHNISRAKIALSGDIRCLGPCTIEVNNPLCDTPLASFSINESGVSTSGDYNRYVKDTKHNHLINPKTKASQQNFISVTLISKLPNSDLDAYATAVSVMPKEKAYGFLHNKAVAYIILERNKQLHISKNIDEYVEELLINNTLKE